MFEKIKTNKLSFSVQTARKRKDSLFNLPALTSSTTNQGLSCFVPKETATILRNVISIASNGNAGTSFYQSRDFTVLQDAYAIRFKNKELTASQYLFFLAPMQSLKNKFNYANKAIWGKVKQEKISLPTLANGNLALDYMESYMQELERCKLEKLETYLKTSGLKDCNLTQQEKETLKRFSLTTQQESDSMWREFKIKDLFRIKSNPQLNKDSFHFTPNGTYPYFTRTCQNNGINGYVDYLDEKHKIDGNSLAVGMLGMRFFYMKKDFYAGQFTKTIYAKFDGFNEKNALYFATSLNKAQAVFQGVLVRDFQKTLENYKIILPINSAGNPDLGFIQDFINALSKLAIKDITLWCERKLSTNKTYKTK